MNLPDGTLCDGLGFFCAGGNCVNCQPAGFACSGVGGCCAGLLCDASNSVCVGCDANKVQTAPAADFGGGKCEASCGASSQCDEQSAGAFVASGICSIVSPNYCMYFDGDVSQAACDSAVGPVPGSWNLGAGSEVAATACCGDDAGEFNRFRDCKPGSCVDNPTDRKCCNADKDCVHNGQCFYDVDTAIVGVQTENAAFCAGKNQNSCTSGASKVKCQWTGSSCVAAASRASVQFSQKTGGSYAAYADVDNDGSDEVCVASSPGQWEGDTFGSVSGVVRNITSTVQGALVRVLGTALTAMTAADGSYAITNVLTGYHDVVASKSGYEASSVYGVFVADGGSAAADFTLVRALGGCEDDCTAVGGELCDAGCHGKGLCWFYSDATKAACDGTFGLVEVPGGQYVDCCMGKAYTPIKAEASVPAAKNVVVTKKPVLYKGRFVNMVIVLFNR